MHVYVFIKNYCTLPMLSVSVSHMSAPFSALGVLDRSVQQSGIPHHFQLLPAPPFILSRNSENKPVEFVRKETRNLYTDTSEKVGTSKPRNYLNVDIAEQPNPCQRRGYTPISLEKQTRLNLEELQSLPDGATEPLYSNSELGDVEPLYTNNVSKEDMEPYYSNGDLREGVEPYYTNNNFR